MRYKIQPGIVLSTVCGESLLVATMKARDKCPYVKQLNSTAAYYWSLLEAGMSLEEILTDAEETYNVSRERVRPGLVSFINSLVMEGYLIPEAEP